MESSHRPISVFPLIVYCIIYFCFGRIPKLALQSFYFYLITIFYTLATGLFWHRSLDSFIKYLFTGSILFILIFSSICFFTSLRKWQISMESIILPLLLSMLFVPIVVGWIQFLSLQGSLPSSSFEQVTSLFSYRHHFFRVQLTCGEPAKAVRLLMLSFFLLLPIRKGITGYILLINILLLFVLAASSLGFLTIPIIILFQLILFPSLGQFKLLLIGLGIFSIVLIGSWEFLPVYTTNRLTNIFGLLENFSLDNLFNYASRDGSFFRRIIHPIMGFHMMIQNFGLGLGGESFSYQYADLIHNHYSFANQKAIALSLRGEVMATPFSMFSKIASEFGILGIGLFGALLWRLRNRIKKYTTMYPSEKHYMWIFSFSLALITFYASYIYFHFVFLLFLLLFKFDMLKPIKLR